jgi:hypothetical protein
MLLMPKKGHFASQCPDNETDKAPDGTEYATEALQQLVLANPPAGYDSYEEFYFHQSQRHVNPNWILIDTCSAIASWSLTLNFLADL